MTAFSEEEYDYLFKLVIVGDSGVGKTQLLNRFTHNNFSIESRSTIGVEFGSKKMITKDQKNVKVQIWDTAGQEKYKAISKVYYQGALGALLVYDITNEKSLDKAQQWLQELKENSSAQIQILLVGNKNDLENERQVKQQYAMEFSEANSLAYIETSAKTAENVEKAFEILIECLQQFFKFLFLEIYSIKKTINEELIITNPEQPVQPAPLPKPQENIILSQNNQNKAQEKQQKKKGGCC